MLKMFIAYFCEAGTNYSILDINKTSNSANVNNASTYWDLLSVLIET